MKGATRERWWNLCEKAANEDDPKKLVGIYRDIICMLDEKAARLFKQWEKTQVQTKRN